MPLQNPDQRAKALQGLVTDERKKRHTTTSVGNTSEGTAIVGTSEEYLRIEIKKAVLPHEMPARSRSGNHAEENVLDEAQERNLNLVEIGASRPICLDCENRLKAKGIEAKTDFSGKPSKNRKRP